MSLAHDLLRVASQLCPNKPGRPSRAVIRRTISTAYYAAFHAISDEVARPYRRDVQPTARRLLDHGQANDVATTLRRRRVVPWLPGEPACDAHLIRFAEAFTRLQTARHQADYNLTVAPTKAEAARAIRQAERVLHALDAVRGDSPDQLQAVCAAMVANAATRKRMVSTP
jgi:hypothetical protein